MLDPKRCLLLLIKYGANNKNLKSAGEALDEIAIYLRNTGQVPFGEAQIKTIAKLVDSKDPSVRENSIQCLAEIYKVLDEDIWRVVGQVPLKVKGLMEQRFRKVKGGTANQLTMSRGPNNTTPAKKPSPRRGGAAASGGQAELTKSFNPGLKNTQTPRN